MSSSSRSNELRLAELVAALSLGIDLGFGQPMEHVLRQCLIAQRLATKLELDAESRAAVYYTSLLVNVGCHSDAHEQAKWLGDDIALKSGKYDSSPGLRGLARMLNMVGAGKPLLVRLRVALELFVSGRRDIASMINLHAKLAQTLAAQLALPTAVTDAVGAAYEQWDGNGFPGMLAGDAIPIASRVAQLAEYVEVAQRVGGAEGVRALVHARAKQFDPKLVRLLEGGEITLGLNAIQAWSAVIDAEPALTIVLSDEQFDAALVAIANFVDLKSPFMLGHSAAVADLAASAGTVLNLPAPDLRSVRRAGWVLGFGRLGVSNAIWDKAGALGVGERERVRMHPYFTERMLQQSAALAPLGRVAVQHRERLDGSGYPKGLSGSAISLHARILGVADAYQAMREPRPHRAAHSSAATEKLLRAEARAGKFPAEVVEAVLEAAGHRARRRPEGPAGLTAREVEVLQLLARGLSTKEIAERLAITAKTAGNHIEHIYSKIDASSRVAASLFAVQHGLLPEPELQEREENSS